LPPLVLHTLGGQPLGPETLLSARATLFGFYKTECPTCSLTFPYWIKLQEAYGKAGLRLLTVAQNTPDEVEDFLHGRHPELDLLLDDGLYLASKAMGILYTPTAFLVDPDGMVQTVIEAWDRGQYVQLAADVARRLGVPPVPLFLSDEEAPLRQFG
jgi:thiol-disulfide isomerase/thioredoxin